MKKHLNPVMTAIRLFGGVRALGRSVDRDPSAIIRWRGHGRLPAGMGAILLTVAKEKGIEMSCDDVVWGRDFDVDEA